MLYMCMYVCMYVCVCGGRHLMFEVGDELRWMDGWMSRQVGKVDGVLARKLDSQLAY